MGEYLITVRSQINVPDTPEKLTFTTFTQEHTFTVFVNPCQVSAINVVQSTQDVNYAIGNSSQTTSAPQYLFEQTPACGYTLDILVSGLPVAIASHDPV